VPVLEIAESAPRLSSNEKTREFAREIRAHALRMVHRANSSHIGSCLSVADLLAVLYGSVLRIDPKLPAFENRDRFILSKGHAAAILYAALAERGFFPIDMLETFCQPGSLLLGHASHHVPGVEVSTGSLGHGLPIGCGIALGAMRQGLPYRVFALLSDGELDEGSNWEAILFAGHHKLDNLIAIVDYNKVQSFGTVNEVLNLEPVVDKWRAFGWAVCEVDGHDCERIEGVLKALPAEPGRPSVVIAHTVKGKGVSFMENKLLWHYRSPGADELASALAEIYS
jgi:transketolase